MTCKLSCPDYARQSDKLSSVLEMEVVCPVLLRSRGHGQWVLVVLRLFRLNLRFQSSADGESNGGMLHVHVLPQKPDERCSRGPAALKTRMPREYGSQFANLRAGGDVFLQNRKQTPDWTPCAKCLVLFS
jgi:hypothetical protein